ncbi:MAG: glucosyltransferase domain-containing protein [Cyanobacteriota bacterium]
MLIDRLLKDKRSIYVEFFVVFFIALLARGNGIFALNWSCDDFLSIADPNGLGYATSQASQLRVFAALTTRVVGWLGAGFPPLGVFWSASHTASMVVFALALRRLWIPRSASIYGVLIGLLFTLFPYHINLLTFQLQHPSMVMSYLTGAYGIANFNQTGRRFWWAVLAIAASLSYQTMIAYFLAAGLMLMLVQLIRHWSGVSQSSWAEDGQPVVAYARLIGLGTVAYLVLALASLSLFKIQASNRTQFADVESWPGKVQLIVNHLKRTAFGQERSMPRSPKLLQSLLWLVVASGLTFDLARQTKHRTRSLVFLPILISVSIFTVASAFLPTILMDHTSENPRNLLATVVFGAGLLALSSMVKSWRLRVLALGLAALIALSYALTTNALNVDLARLTQRDLLVASRMVELLDQQSGSRPVRTVVFVGRYSPSVDLLGREYYQSGFEVPWAQLPLLREASGQAFVLPSPGERQAALALAANRPAWPARDAVAVQGDVGLIVLSQDKP